MPMDLVRRDQTLQSALLAGRRQWADNARRLIIAAGGASRLRAGGAVDGDRADFEEFFAMAKLGLDFAFYASGPYSGLVQVGREAEDAGYDCLLVHEGQASNDALMCCYMLAAATNRVSIMTNVANIYLREPSLCASAAATIQQESQNRFILGIGISHRPVLGAMGIEMGNGRGQLRSYTQAMRQFSTGEAARSF